MNAAPVVRGLLVSLAFQAASNIRNIITIKLGAAFEIESFVWEAFVPTV